MSRAACEKKLHCNAPAKVRSPSMAIAWLARVVRLEARQYTSWAWSLPPPCLCSWFSRVPCALLFLLAGSSEFPVRPQRQEDCRQGRG